jgi:hypothetical protein
MCPPDNPPGPPPGLVATNFMVGRFTASAIASASRPLPRSP